MKREIIGGAELSTGLSVASFGFCLGPMLDSSRVALRMVSVDYDLQDRAQRRTLLRIVRGGWIAHC
jgi:hypothetical protein